MKVDHLFPPKPDLDATPVLVDHPEVGGVVLRGVGHPWGDGPPEEKADWDGMELIATSKAALDRVVAAAEKRYWKAWIVGTQEDDQFPFGAYLFKPSGVNQDWDDSPQARRTKLQGMKLR